MSLFVVMHSIHWLVALSSIVVVYHTWNGVRAEKRCTVIVLARGCDIVHGWEVISALCISVLFTP